MIPFKVSSEEFPKTYEAIEKAYKTHYKQDLVSDIVMHMIGMHVHSDKHAYNYFNRAIYNGVGKIMKNRDYDREYGCAVEELAFTIDDGMDLIGDIDEFDDEGFFAMVEDLMPPKAREEYLLSCNQESMDGGYLPFGINLRKWLSVNKDGLQWIYTDYMLGKHTEYDECRRILKNAILSNKKR